MAGTTMREQLVPAGNEWQPEFINRLRMLERSNAKLRSTPRVRTVADRVQFAFRVAREAKWLEQGLLISHHFLGDQMPYANHLVPMVAVRDDMNVFSEPVEYGKAVRCKAAKTAGWFFFESDPFSREAFLAEGQC